MVPEDMYRPILLEFSGSMCNITKLELAKGLFSRRSSLSMYEIRFYWKTCTHSVEGSTSLQSTTSVNSIRPPVGHMAIIDHATLPSSAARSLDTCCETEVAHCTFFYTDTRMECCLIQ